MKITIHNLGPIHCCQFDTAKSFQVVLGKNSVGKSYALTFVYIIIKTLLALPDVLTSRSRIEPIIDQTPFDQQLKRLVPYKEYEPRNVTGVMDDLLRLLFDAFLSEHLREPIASSFGGVATLGNQYSPEAFRVEIEAERHRIELGIHEERICVTKVACGTYWSKRMRTNRWPEDTSSVRMLFVNSDLSKTRALVVREATDILRQVAKELSADIGGIYYLPAIRSGLYQALSGLGPIVAELSKSRSLVTREISLPYLTTPQNDYFLTMSRMSTTDVQTAHPLLLGLAQSIEEDIAGGRIDLDADSNRLVFTPATTSLRLDLGATSSMVSQIAPLVAYCRYVLGKTQLQSAHGSADASPPSAMIIIEEPEAHLHPQAQVQLVEQLAALSRIGIKVVLTSHSDYLFNKVSNLVSAGVLASESVSATLFTMGEHGSEGKSLAIDGYGIDDENFVEVAEALYMEKAEALADDA